MAGCPDPSVLEAFVQGTLDAGARAQLEGHLDGCRDCSQTIAELVRLYGSASWGAGVTPSMGSHAAASLAQTHPSQGAGAVDPSAGQGIVTVGRYQLGSRLGAGGMGVVFEAHDPELHRRVAIKLLHPGATEDAEVTRARLLREARAMAQLSHPNVVAVHDVGRVGDQIFLAMELVDGTTLSQWLKGGTRSHKEILETFVQAGRGLQAAHEVGMVHRDFKPDNVLIGVDGRARVTDFGLAQPAAWTDGDAPAGSTSGEALKMSVAITTAHGAIVGTPAYMAPEQWQGRAADARSDQFSFCVALYEALFDERPFFGRTWMELSGNVLSGKTKPPPRGTPGWLRAALLRGLSIDPTARHPAMAPLLGALTRDRGRAVRIGAIAGAMGLGALATVGVLTWMADETTPVGTNAGAGSGGEDSGAAEESGATQLDEPGSTGSPTPDEAGTGTPAREDPCLARAETADGIWTADRRERLIERMHKMERGLAIVSQTMPVLDAWVEAYAAEAKKLCDPAPDLEHVDARRRCLEDRGARLDALADRMVTHETFSIDESVAGAAHSLPPIERCGEPKWLAGAPEAPASSIAAKARLLTTDLAAVEADTSLFKLTSAPGDGEHVAKEADALGYRPLLAEAELAMGLLAARRYQTSFAVSWLERAAVSAESADHEEAQVRAAIALVVQQGAIMIQPAATKRWLRIASSIADRIDEPRLTAEVRLATATAQRGILELTTARATSKEAITAHEEAFGDEHPWVALALIEASNVAYDLLDAEQAKQHADRAAKLLRKTLGPDDLRLCVALTALARAQLLAGELEAAAKTIETAVKIPFPSSSLRHDYDRGDALLVQGDIEAAQGDHEAALKTYEKAEIYHYTGDRKAQPPLRRGALLVQIGRNADGLKVLAAALAELESHYDADDPRLVAALRALGEAQSKAGQHKAARATLERAVKIADDAVGFGPFTARSKIDLAKAERVAGNHERALELFDDAHVPWVGGYGMHHPKVVEELLARADLAYRLGNKKYAGRLYRTNADDIAELYGEESEEAKRALARKTDD